MADPWAEIAQTHTVHQESHDFVEKLNAMGAKRMADLTPDGAKKQFEELALKLSGEIEFDGEVFEVNIPSPNSPEGIPATIYKPSSRPETPAIFLYFHGGALVFFSRRSHETCLKTIARDSGAIVVSVEYRLLGEEVDPLAPFDDVVQAAKWLLENKEAVGGRPESKVGVGGDSSGGQLAICVTNDVPGFDFQVLVYPNCDLSYEHASIQEFANAPCLGEKDIEWACKYSLDLIPGCITDPRTNSMARTNTEQSPPALVLLAEIDPIRDCGMAYAEKLRAAGVSVRIIVIEGVPHIFFTFPGIFKSKCEEAYGHVVQFIKEYQ
ncbi:carboxylesterase NlhH [Biomphalaria glabrata]